MKVGTIKGPILKSLLHCVAIVIDDGILSQLYEHDCKFVSGGNRVLTLGCCNSIADGYIHVSFIALEWD